MTTENATTGTPVEPIVRRGPVYEVPLLDTLPIGGMLQALPSRDDLSGILDGRSGTRIVCGYEVLMMHYRKTRDAFEAARAFIDSHVADPDLTDEMVERFTEYREAVSALE